jgi:hypothetical protein
MTQPLRKTRDALLRVFSLEGCIHAGCEDGCALLISRKSSHSVQHAYIVDLSVRVRLKCAGERLV